MPWPPVVLPASLSTGAGLHCAAGCPSGRPAAHQLGYRGPCGARRRGGGGGDRSGDFHDGGDSGADCERNSECGGGSRRCHVHIAHRSGGRGGDVSRDQRGRGLVANLPMGIRAPSPAATWGGVAFSCSTHDGCPFRVRRECTRGTAALARTPPHAHIMPRTHTSPSHHQLITGRPLHSRLPLQIVVLCRSTAVLRRPRAHQRRSVCQRLDRRHVRTRREACIELYAYPYASLLLTCPVERRA